MSNKTDENRKNNTGSGKQPEHWSGVFAMTLCVFALIASEFMPVSLLTPMAQTLRVTEGMAGQGIAISGTFAVVTSLFISVLAGTLNRKTLLLGLTCIMAISGAVIAMAPNYLTYMAGRALIGIVVGGFWSMSAATVTLVLLVIGVAGFIGTTLIGRVLKSGFYPTLMAIPVLMAITALALIAFGSHVAIVTALLGLWGLISTSAPVGWWAWVPHTFPQNAEAGGGLMVAMVQLSIALGSTVGGLLFDHHGYQSTFLASAAMLIIATVLIFLTSRADTSAADHS